VKIRTRSLAGSAAALTFGLLLTLSASAQVAISINGNGVDVSPSPLIQDGRVFVPLRGVFENLGATVVYSNGRINATGNGRDIALEIGSTQATVNGQPETIDVAPFIVGASTYVPLRFVSQALGADVSWDGNDRVVEISMSGLQSQSLAVPSNAQDGDWVDSPPPAIPAYEPPPAPEPNDIWVPGYWAWGEGGYYWVAGTWTQAPQPDYLWTPGYWASNNSAYVWHQGYWGPTVGFYGGINYGAGYYGRGYVGGRWSGNQFQYNTAVTPVNRTVIHNVYVDKTVIVNNTTVNNHISYNGGPHGVAARPTAAEVTAARAPHQPMTPPQQQHAQVAGQDRRNLATVNAGKPPVVAVPSPFTRAAKPAGAVPVTTNDRSAGGQLIARPPVTSRVAPTTVAPPVAAPARPAFVRPPAQAPARPAAVAPAAVAPPAAAPARPAFVRPPAQAPARPAAVAPAAVAPPAAAPARPAFVRPQAQAPARPAAVMPPAAATRPVTSIPVFVHHAPAVPVAPVAPAVRPVTVRPPAAVAAPARPAAVAAPAPVRPARQIPPGEARARPQPPGAPPR
jgi:hypothetical protein